MWSNGVYAATGDSTSWANYETGKKVYGQIIADKLGAVGPIQYVNKGIGGTTAAKFLSLMDYWLGNIPFDLITVGLGMNDCVNNGANATFEADLKAIVDRLKRMRPTAEIILCGPTATSEATRVDYIANYRTTMSNVATSKGVFYCNLGAAFTVAEVATHTSDTIHPNATGTDDIVNVLWPVVQQTNWYKGLASKAAFEGR